MAITVVDKSGEHTAVCDCDGDGFSHRDYCVSHTLYRVYRFYIVSRRVDLTIKQHGFIERSFNVNDWERRLSPRQLNRIASEIPFENGEWIDGIEYRGVRADWE